MKNTELLFKDVQDKRVNFLETYHKFWVENAFLSWQWWMLLITTILMWILWVKLVDRNRVHFLLNFGLIIGGLSVTLDVIGTNHGAWAYPIHLYWAFIPPLIPFDLSYLPVIYMLIYQRYGQRWFNFLLALIVSSAFISFIIEPLFHWVGIYALYKWKYIYSFPIYVLLGCFVKVLVELINKKLH